MIEFVTLLLGLVAGPRQVDLAPQGPVAAVEIRLNGRLVHRLEEAPWRLEVDFGHRLVPHRLTASAFDDNGRLLDTKHQIINYSRASFEAAIVLDPTNLGPARRGRVIWQGALEAPPQKMELRFDDDLLAIDASGEFDLPDHDPEVVHVLEASVVFADGSTGIASLTFGGQYIDQTTTALTALPMASPRRKTWTVEQVDGWIERDGEPLEVFTVTAPTGLAVVLRDLRLDRNIRSVMPWREVLERRPYSTAAESAYGVMAISSRPLEGSPGTFRLSRPNLVHPRHGLRGILLHQGSLVPSKSIDGRRLVKKGQKLWDSLAVAALQASRKNTPRLIVLMIGNKLEDSSRLTAQQAVDYLDSIHVPLLVWAPTPRDLFSFGLEGHDHVFVGLPGLTSLEELVGSMLRSQYILWVKGEHLPNELSLGSTVPAGVGFAH